MKRLAFFSLLLLCLFVLMLTPLAQADHPEPFAKGSVRFSLADGLLKQVEFAARLHDDGTTTGEMTFIGASEVKAQNVVGTKADTSDTSPTSGQALYFKAALDCMVVTGARAVMGGAVTESSAERYLGQRVLLVVQDAGETTGAASADKLTWGVYNLKPRTWTPSDSELENDTAAWTTWLATDSERDDDVGSRSDKTKFIGCRSFPLSSFSLVKVKLGDGDIQVRP